MKKTTNTLTLILGSIFVVASGVYVCLAESFLAAPPVSARKRTAGQVKQETMEVCADILLNTSKTIETQAYLQQQLCARIQELAENNKQGLFAQLEYKDMEQCLKELKAFQAQQEKNLNDLKRTIQLVQTGHSKKVV